MRSEAIKTVIELLGQNAGVSDYKINVTKKESYELFFVKGKLETVRCTDTCDRKITVYADHDNFRGDAAFYLYPSTTKEQMKEKVDHAVRDALLICNAPYSLVKDETGDFALNSNLDTDSMPELAQKIADLVFAANTEKDGSLNSVEIFLDRYTESVKNSQGLFKTQHRCSAMVEAIPTFNGDRESVELYEQYNFSSLDEDVLLKEISDKMTAVKARYEAVKPDFALDCPVVLHKQELNDLFSNIADDLNYATVYSHSNLFHKGDAIQKEILGDALTITMKGAEEGNIASSAFDSDGMSLGKMTLVENGKAVHYYGSNRFGQYMNENPTGNLGCLCVAPGTAEMPETTPYLEVLSMSGLQVDFFNNYIGGEIRLAYYHDGASVRPVTGISISGALKDVLNHIRLSKNTAAYDGYTGPESAVCTGMKIF